MGRTLKHPEQRVNRVPPTRGEWVDLEPLETPILGQSEPEWPARVRRMWDAWRMDPVTTQYGESDVAAITFLAAEFYELPPAQRIALMNCLGLTPKGKRDLRWRTPNEVKTIKAAAEKAKVRGLHSVPAPKEGK